MKKLVFLTVAILCFTLQPVSAMESEVQLEEKIDTPTTRNLATTTVFVDIEIGSYGRTTLYGDAFGYPSMVSEAEVKVSIQRYANGSWKTLRSWSNRENRHYAQVSVEGYYVAKGYIYRAKLDSYMYDDNGNCIEHLTNYSGTESY